MNEENEIKYSKILEEFHQAKRDIEDERVKMKTELHDVHVVHSSYIEKLKHVMKRDYERFNQQVEYSDLQLEVAKAHSKILRGRIDKYLEVAK